MTFGKLCFLARGAGFTVELADPLDSNLHSERLLYLTDGDECLIEKTLIVCARITASRARES